MIFFMKIGCYSPIKDGLDKFDSLKLLTLGKYNPHIDNDDVERYFIDIDILKDIDYVLCSDLNRAKDTFLFLKDRYLKKECVYEETELLREVTFDIESLCSKEEYVLGGSNIVRKRFIESFLNDNFIETRKDVSTRVNKVNKRIKEISGKHKNVLVISHTFFLKILQIENENKGFILNNPILLLEKIDPNKKIMNFFEITSTHS